MKVLMFLRSSEVNVSWMTLSVVIVLTFVFTVNHLFAQYRDSRFPFNDLAFVDKKTGWVVGNNGTILKTTDGGSSWHRQFVSDSINLTQIQMFDDQRGFIGGDSATLLMTRNGGNHWLRLSVPLRAAFSDIFFLNERIGWIVSSDSIFQTRDGGGTWHGTMNPGIWRVAFWNDSIGWGYNWKSEIFLTQDGGFSWVVKRKNRYPIGWYHHDIFLQGFAVSSTRAVFVGEGSNHYDQWGFIAETLDGGVSWQEKQYLWTKLNDVRVLLDTVVAFGSGYAASPPGGIIIHSGRTLQNGYPPFTRVSFPNAITGWSISNRYSFAQNYDLLRSSTLYRTTDGGYSWQELKSPLTSVDVKANPRIVEKFALHQNYPNPFNPATVIRFTLPGVGKRHDVSLRVFNMLGQEVATLVNGEMEAGYHQVQWQAEGLPSGVYFYRLEAGSFAETKKMMLVR